MSASTERFSERVENYVRYRPGYPSTLIRSLIEKSGIGAGSMVADVGSGTGIFTQQLLQQGLRVAAIEPNAPMRAAAETLLSGYSGFSSISASAESTGLSEQSVDLITAAQAFHWFNNESTRTEFARILKPEGNLALIWNQRKTSQAFQQAYDAALREYSVEYDKVNHMNLDDDSIAEFYSDGSMKFYQFENAQLLDFESLLGRLKSASYCPPEDSPEYRALARQLASIFVKHADRGVICFEYETRLFLGAIN